MSPAHARRNLTVAFIDLAFALIMFGCGLFDAPPLAPGLAAGAMVAYWAYSRRRVLSRLRGRTWAIQTGLALSVIIAIMAGAYWLGLGVKDLI